MGKKITLQPLLPKLVVEKVDEGNIEEFAEFLCKHKELFPALEHVLAATIRKNSTRIYIYDYGRSDEEMPVICKVGDWLVVSENGTRHFTDSRIVHRGVVDGLPREMFTPIEADVLDVPSFI